MWSWIWTVLVLLALVVILALCWRIFQAVKALLITVGDVSAEAERAGVEAERQQAAWLEERARADEEYLAERREAARPVPADLRPFPDVSSSSPQPTREAHR